MEFSILKISLYFLMISRSSQPKYHIPNSKFEKQKNTFFLISQGSFKPKIWFLGQKVWPVARSQTGPQTDRQNDCCGHPFRVSVFFLQPMIKDQTNFVYDRIFKIIKMFSVWPLIISIVCFTDNCLVLTTDQWTSTLFPLYCWSTLLHVHRNMSSILNVTIMINCR